MSSDNTPEKPIWEGFALLGLRFARTITEIAEIQTKRIEHNVTARADAFYAQRDALSEPRRRAFHSISAMFDDVMDRLRKEEED